MKKLFIFIIVFFIVNFFGCKKVGNDLTFKISHNIENNIEINKSYTAILKIHPKNIFNAIYKIENKYRLIEKDFQIKENDVVEVELVSSDKDNLKIYNITGLIKTEYCKLFNLYKPQEIVYTYKAFNKGSYIIYVKLKINSLVDIVDSQDVLVYPENKTFAQILDYVKEIIISIAAIIVAIVSIVRIFLKKNKK